jgi:hypothetical protein
MLTVTDLATAERLGLSTAKLVNPNGEPVEANTESINSSISEFVESNVAGVKVSTPTLAKDESYPLATLTYAAIDVCRASISELKSYKSLLSYIAGKGQIIGTGEGEIPVGYVPLDDSQIGQTRKVISQISAEISSPVCPEHLESASTDFDATVPPELPTEDLGTPVTEASAAATGKFPGDPSSALRYSMLSALCFGIPMIAGGRTLIRKAKTL